MEKLNVTSLNQNELKEINGGMPLLIIMYMTGGYCIKRIVDFVDGVKEGYQRAVSTN
jgi:hypothetical protein